MTTKVKTCPVNLSSNTNCWHYNGKCVFHLSGPIDDCAFPASIKTINQLKVALYKDFGLKESEQFKELNITGWSELVKTPAEAYQAVAVLRIK